MVVCGRSDRFVRYNLIRYCGRPPDICPVMLMLRLSGARTRYNLGQFSACATQLSMLPFPPPTRSTKLGLRLPCLTLLPSRWSRCDYSQGQTRQQKQVKLGLRFTNFSPESKKYNYDPLILIAEQLWRDNAEPICH
jgi:hypothetical protein